MAVINKIGLEGKESFLGFWFNGRHSSEFRIIRVSGGKEFEEELLSTAKDTTIDIPGRDGSEFIQAKREKKQFKIEFAFDDLYENDIRAMKQWLGVKNPCELIFDERPYKVWTGKVTTAPRVNFVPFDDTEKGVVYKGSGNITFTCFKPYARSKSRGIADYQQAKATEPSQIPFNYLMNIKDWVDSSGIKYRDPISRKGYELSANGWSSRSDRVTSIFYVPKGDSNSTIQIGSTTSVRYTYTNDPCYLTLGDGISTYSLSGPNTHTFPIEGEGEGYSYIVISYNPDTLYVEFSDNWEELPSLPYVSDILPTYNGGDLPVAPKIILDITNVRSDYLQLLYSEQPQIILKKDVLMNVPNGEDGSKKIIIDNEMQLILDANENSSTSNQTRKIYNNAIIAGSFFKLEPGENEGITVSDENVTVESIDFDYLYY